jgi:hypothetical protein
MLRAGQQTTPGTALVSPLQSPDTLAVDAISSRVARVAPARWRRRNAFATLKAQLRVVQHRCDVKHPGTGIQPRVPGLVTR